MTPDRGGVVGATSAQETVLAAIESVETRDLERLAALYDPAVAFDWPPGLPYSGHYEGRDVATMTERFASVWLPLQQTDEQRRMEPTVVATASDTVVVQYVARGADAAGRRFETPVLARYRARGGRLVEAQMYYWDLIGLQEFIKSAGVAGSAR
jgi:ketosteroid isomerase-like protein